MTTEEYKVNSPDSNERATTERLTLLDYGMKAFIIFAGLLLGIILGLVVGIFSEIIPISC